MSMRYATSCSSSSTQSQKTSNACFARLYEEKQGELLGALLSGDQKTFELFRTEAPELRHLPAATYEWYSKNYLDRDYPLRFILMCNGVEFPDTPEEDK